MSYAELIALAMQGKGRMTNREIYLRVLCEALCRRESLSPNWKATIRNTLQRHSRQSDKFTPPYLFIYHRRNLWEAR